MTRRTRERYRQKAYGRYVGRVTLTGTIRRFQGLQVMGWRAEDMAAELGLTHPPALFRMLRQKYITPETRDRFAAATDRLVRRGRGPSTVTAQRALRKGWVSLLAWENLDDDEAPVTIQREIAFRGPELMAEIDHLVSLGESPDSIAKALGRTAVSLEQNAWRHGRGDLTSFFNRAAKREAA
ncbi:hypothetical protein J2X63_003206 [Agromyces sp. 3263]|uniref:hypothetical protein n=1 Tax=Agromyces sp. 3263 TaxID=2817750 RepID=UPI002863FA10|nr:hypothetical protein [Agromyces sp. 3263]MDR6907498.1 hypothetical protein [Agromyces sp. 3263]